jgi:uncharacterized protein
MTLSRRGFLRLGSLTMMGFAGGGTRYLGASNALEVTRTTVELPGPGRDFTIALVTDVHAPQPGLDWDGVVAAANAARPDLVLVVGDSVNRRGDEGLVEMMAPLSAGTGKYATAGNWENWGRVRRSQMDLHYARAGTAWLDNDATEIDDLGVRIVGVDESLNGWTDWSLLASAPVDRPLLVLHHSPAAFDRLPLPAGATALMLSGHTHGGQWAPLGRPLVLPPGCGGYLQGRYARPPHTLYVSRGIGNSHVPFRVGARPELALITVTRRAVSSSRGAPTAAG